MPRRLRTLSMDDQKAVDVCLDHAVTAGKSSLTRMATPVQQRRLEAVNQLFAVLGEMPVEDPTADLVSRTMKRIAESQPHGAVQSMPSAADVNSRSSIVH